MFCAALAYRISISSYELPQIELIIGPALLRVDGRIYRAPLLSSSDTLIDISRVGNGPKREISMSVLETPPLHESTPTQREYEETVLRVPGPSDRFP